MVGFTEGLKNWMRSGKIDDPVNKTCHDPAQDLVDCMMETECFQAGRSIKDCATNDSTSAQMCKRQINEWFLCRKFTVDNRKHFVKDTYK